MLRYCLAVASRALVHPLFDPPRDGGRVRGKKEKKKKTRIFVVLLSASFRQVRKTIRARDTEPTNDADSFQFLRCRRFVGKDDEERVKDGLWVGDSLTPAAREAFMHADVCTFYILRRAVSAP